MDEVRAEMEDELNVSCKKWGIHLNTESRDGIVVHSMNQLRKKVSESAKNNWDFDSKLSIRVSSVTRSGDISLPSASMVNSKLRLIKSREGWEMEQEPSEESVLISEFPDHFKAKIKTWGRTAVFYGVASYAH